MSADEGRQAVEHLEVRRGEYHDSVTLLAAGRAVATVPEVTRVLVAMGTELNTSLLDTLGYTPPDGAGPSDLIIAFTCPDPTSESAALTALSTALTPTTPITASGDTPPDEPHPRTTATALGRTSGSLTLISTPGLAAIPEAMESLQYGASVVIFSDNVPLPHEIRLKDEARRRNLLVMGPDCGTVVLHGTGLGFTNATRPGPISLVAASGTGAQHLMSLLESAGLGTRHCLGVGGRDLTEAVAGRSTHAALDALAADEDTHLIAVVSKPPHPAVAASIKAHAAQLPKPVHLAFIGPDQPTLTEAAERILSTLNHEIPSPWPQWPPADDARAVVELGGRADSSSGRGIGEGETPSFGESGRHGDGQEPQLNPTRAVGPSEGESRELAESQGWDSSTARSQSTSDIQASAADPDGNPSSGSAGSRVSGTVRSSSPAESWSPRTVRSQASVAAESQDSDTSAAWRQASDAVESQGSDTSTARNRNPDAPEGQASSSGAASSRDLGSRESHYSGSSTARDQGSAAPGSQNSGAGVPASPASGAVEGQASVTRRQRGRTVRGLFSGGTLCAEAEAVLARMRARELEDGLGGWGEGEREELEIDLTDFGDDAYTRGRPHPMIDNTLRLRAADEAVADPRVGALLLDVVLGRGAHADPAAELVPVAVAAARRGLPVVVSLCGTEGDPQGLQRQARAFADAGAWVYVSNAEAALAAGRLAWCG